MLIHGKQLHDVVAGVEDGAQTCIVGEIDEIETGRDLDQRRITRAASSSGCEPSMAWMKDGPSLAIS